MSYIFNEKELIEAEQEEALIIASNERQKELDELNANPKAILISIQPQWVEQILNSEKTIEIRKTMPKCKLPIKVYIYCTKGKELWGDGSGETWNGIDENEDMELVYEYTPTLARLNEKIVAEFTLNDAVKFDIESIIFLGKEKELMQKAKIGGLSLRKYLGNKIGYAWNIEDLKIYDKPKELSDFEYPDKPICYNDNKNAIYGYLTGRKLIRPPQSWCYVRPINE